MYQSRPRTVADLDAKLGGSGANGIFSFKKFVDHHHLEVLVLWNTVIDSGLVGSTEGYLKSRRCSKDTYPESYNTKYTSILIYKD